MLSKQPAKMSLFSDHKIVGLRYMTCSSIKCLWDKLHVIMMNPEIKLIIFGETGHWPLANIVCPTSVFGVWSLLFASLASSQICTAKLASKHRTSNICLPTSKMCLTNMKYLKNLVLTKRASKDKLLKLSHVR